MFDVVSSKITNILQLLYASCQTNRLFVLHEELEGRLQTQAKFLLTMFCV